MVAFKKSPLTGAGYQDKDLTPFERDLKRQLANLMTNMDAILNRGITFTENVNCDFLDYTSNPIANIEKGITHNLGKVPRGFIVCNMDKAGIVWGGNTSWTNETIYLKCNVASAIVTIIVF